MQFQIKQVNIAWMLDIWDSSRCSSNKTTLLHSIRLNAKRVLLIWGEEPLPLEIMATMHFKPQEILAGCSNQRVKMIYLGWEETCLEMTISGSKTRLEMHPLSRIGSSTSTCRTFQSQSQRNDKMRLWKSRGSRSLRGSVLRNTWRLGKWKNRAEECSTWGT